jgi:hypothetical protein
MHHNMEINEAKGYPPSSGLCEVPLIPGLCTLSSGFELQGDEKQVRG